MDCAHNAFSDWVSSMKTKPMPTLTSEDLLRFWAKVKIRDDYCWLWQAAKDDIGYGIFAVGSRNLKVHRLAYLIHTGIDPLDQLVSHTCGSPACVHPVHLIIGAPIKRIRSSKNIARRKDATHSNIIREVQRRISTGELGKNIALALGLSQATVSKIKKGRLEPIDATSENGSYWSLPTREDSC